MKLTQDVGDAIVFHDGVVKRATYKVTDRYQHSVSYGFQTEDGHYVEGEDYDDRLDMYLRSSDDGTINYFEIRVLSDDPDNFDANSVIIPDKDAIANEAVQSMMLFTKGVQVNLFGAEDFAFANLTFNSLVANHKFIEAHGGDIKKAHLQIFDDVFNYSNAKAYHESNGWPVV